VSNLESRLRAGRGPFWGAAKKLARSILSFHVPVNGATRPIFSALYSLHVWARESLQWLARLLWYEPLFRSQCESIGPGFRMEQLPYLMGNGRIVIGAGVRISGKIDIGFSLLEGATAPPLLSIGDGTFIGHGCGLTVGREVRIGRNCLLASGTKIRDWDGHSLDAAERRSHKREGYAAAAPVIIGDDAWIGASATILKGIRIGDRAVVAAGAIVTRDVARDTVVAGIPARVVKELDPPPSAETGTVRAGAASTT
jgi:acetyltransferase-like isoleucine patch superfamily enzyme